MEQRETLPDARHFAAALDWWREAGVTMEFADDATEWLAEPIEAKSATKPGKPAQPKKPAQHKQPEATEPEPEKIAPFGGPSTKWPTDLASFRDWWLEEPSLDVGGTGPRIAPRGAAAPELMVIVAEPEKEDSDTLLSGPQGRLLDGFLRAAGIDAGKIYVAAALPRAVALPDWPKLHAGGLGKLLEHHAHLVNPHRILVFGRNILPLIGHDTAQGPAVLREFNHDKRSVPVLGSRGLADLLRSATGRKRLWQRWLDWTDG